jgi:hypothetical protein
LGNFEVLSIILKFLKYLGFEESRFEVIGLIDYNKSSFKGYNIPGF